MQGIEFFARNFCHEFVSPLANCFHEKPYCERFSLYWRDVPLLAGLATATCGVAAAILQGNIFLSLTLTIAGGAIAFASPYVTRYPELKEMEVQLTRFRESNNDLANQVCLLNSTKIHLESQVTQFERANESFKQSLIDLKTAEPRLQITLDQLSQASEMLAKCQNEYYRTLSEERYLLGKIESETQELAKIRNHIKLESAHFSRIRTDLQSQVEKLSQLAIILNPEIGQKISALATALSSNYPVVQNEQYAP